MKKLFASLTCFALMFITALCFVGCGKTKSSQLYNINFGGNIEGEKYNVEATTWEKSNEEGFDAVYTLKGEVPYNKDVADALGYSDGRVNFTLIRFTSDKVKRVSYNAETKEGFYCEITNFYGTESQAEPVVKHGGFGSGNEQTKQTTYFLYQGVDDQIRTMRVKISFDGTEENARVYKFVIDPKNYTLEEAPQTQAN